MVVVFLFLLSLFIYLFTVAPTVYWWDTGEAITGCSVLGVGHSPGYALYHIIGKLFTFLPVGNEAVRCNFSSVFFASVCIILYFNILKIVFKQKELLIFSTLIFLFSHTLWFFATISSAITIYYLAIVGILLNLSILSERQDFRYLYLFFLIFGLTLLLHIATLPLIVAFIYFVIVTKTKISIRHLFIGSFLVLVSLSVQIYLPIRASSNPGLNFGNVYQFDNFYKMVTFQLATTGPHLIDSIKSVIVQLKAVLYFIMLQFSYILLPMCGIGFYYLLKVNKRIFGFLFLIFIIPILPFIIFSAGEEDLWNLFYFLIPSYIILFIFFQSAIEYISKFLNKKLLIVAFSIMVVIQFLFGYHMNNRRDYYNAYSSGKKVFNKTEKEAIIITDNIGLDNLLKYYKHTPKYDDKIVICALYLRQRWYLDELKKKLVIPDRLFNYCNDKIEYNDEINAKIAKEIFLNNRNYTWYTIFSKSKEQEVFTQTFEEFPQKHLFDIIEYENEYLPKPFISAMSKIDK